MTDWIDLRSDTITRPTPAMRKAMAEAEVGDDVFGEDPTVRRLEERACELFAKPAAVFVSSGTMGNQASIGAHTRHGQELICDDRSHIMLYEMGMAAQLSGCLARSVATADGRLSWADIQAKLRGPSDHYRGVGLIAVENTHNAGGGLAYHLDALREIQAGARAAGVPVHMDGARVFNAATALGVPVSEIAATVDSLTFCLSKGLGAPVGSVVVGEVDFIDEVRLIRKGLGGGMRQAGVIAAAGLVALEETPPLLATDHANAQVLADRINELDGLALDGPPPQTNLIFFKPTPDSGLTVDDVRERLKKQGVLASGGGGRLRLVTHRDVSVEACRRAADALASVVGAGAAA